MWNSYIFTHLFHTTILTLNTHRKLVYIKKDSLEHQSISAGKEYDTVHLTHSVNDLNHPPNLVDCLTDLLVPFP